MRADADPTVQGAEVRVAFRDSMSMMASAVSLVTTHVDGRPWGMTITACCSVSASPPMILVSLASSTVSASAIRATGEYGLCLLGARAMDVAKFGSAPAVPKFLDTVSGFTVPGAGNTPCVRGSLAHLDCELADEVAAGDHSIFIGRVRDVCFPSSGNALVYSSRQYQRVVPAMEVRPTLNTEHQLAYSGW